MSVSDHQFLMNTNAQNMNAMSANQAKWSNSRQINTILFNPDSMKTAHHSLFWFTWNHYFKLFPLHYNYELFRLFLGNRDLILFNQGCQEFKIRQLDEILFNVLKYYFRHPIVPIWWKMKPVVPKSYTIFFT